MKFSEIEYVNTFQQKKIQQKNNFRIVKIDQNEENRKNSNFFMKLSEIWYVDAFQHKKTQQRNNF